MSSGALFSTFGAGLASTEALIPHALERWFGVSGNYTLLFGGLALIATLIKKPEGIAGAVNDRLQRRGAYRGRSLTGPSDDRPPAGLTSSSL